MLSFLLKDYRPVEVNGQTYYVQIIKGRICDEIGLYRAGKVAPVWMYSSILCLEQLEFDKLGICSRHNENYLVHLSRWYAKDVLRRLKEQYEAESLRAAQMDKFYRIVV